VSVGNILLILLRNTHVDRCDPAYPAHPAPAAARPGTLTASRLRVLSTLDATEVPAITPPEGKPRVGLRIRLPDRAVIAEIAAKSLRKAQTAVRDAGADNNAFVLQGRLVAADVIQKRSSARSLSRRSDCHNAEINHRSAAMCLEGAEGASRHEPRTYDSMEICMPYPPKRRSNPREPVPAAPLPSAASAPEGMENTRALARRYLPDAVRLFAGIAFAPDKAAQLAAASDDAAGDDIAA
jgi:hypothetical protein